MREEQKRVLSDSNQRTKAEIDAYLAKIRKTIAESESIVSGVELRLAETDKLLASQGLTRAQVMSIQVSDSQRRAVNEELRRRGLDPLEEEDPWHRSFAAAPAPSYSASDELAERREKFGMMMKPFQI